MKHLKRILCLLVCLYLIPALALGERQYLIADSNTRLLTESELYEWDRESLYYILNEIFARHGYVFKSGGKYDTWFRSMPWYTPNANSDNQRYCYPYMSSLEWQNEATIKRVIAAREKTGEPSHSSGKKCYSDFTLPTAGISLTGFNYIQLQTGQSLPVYSAPNPASWRGANGRATVMTNGAIWASGWDNGYLQIYYETNSNACRVGYVYAGDVRGNINVYTTLDFSHNTCRVIQNCNMTDDPLKTNAPMRLLASGEIVTYLNTVINQYGASWDYIETRVDGKIARGYIPSGFLGF